MNFSKTAFILVLLVSISSTNAQIGKYTGGSSKPAITEGGKPLHALVVFVTFDDDDDKKDASGIWNVGELPSYASDLFDNDTSDGITPYSLTDYWFNMSHGKFVFTGDIYPETVTLRPAAYYAETRRNFGETNREVLEKIKNQIDFKKYDNWSYNYREKRFESVADGIADMIIMIYRDPDAKWFTRGSGEEFSAIALLGTKEYEVVSGDGVSIISKPIVNNDVSGLTVRAGLKSKLALIEIISHEYAHFLFKSGHSAIGGIMGGSTFALNAWEKIALGYITPTVVNSDTSTFLLNDFLSSGEVLKVNYPPDLENSSRFFLIENHTRTNRYDFIARGGEANGRYTLDGDYGKGIYVYKYSSGNHYPPKVNLLTADGLWKWNITDTVKNSSLCGCDVPIFTRIGPDKDNGKSDREIKIYFNKALWDMWYDIDPFTGELTLSRDNMGDEYDAFTEGMVFSQWSNPSSNISKQRTSFFGFYINEISEEGVVNLELKFNDSTKFLPPASPEELEGSIIDEQVLLSWQTNKEPSMKEGSKYIVYRKTEEDNKFSEVGTVPHIVSAKTEFKDDIEDIESKVIYYMIKAQNSEGRTSSASQIIRIKTNNSD
ncbi:MAG: hypothetical protein SCALA702_10320 [Melioribacteraceae bacterium]|nr:MAG: hypothetical protein SCALA702_10320 [Melioribacteraceae bacterium]